MPHGHVAADNHNLHGDLLVCRPQVGAEFVTAVNLRHRAISAAEHLG